MFEKYYIGHAAADLNKSKAFEPYSKVVIIAGEDEDGNQIVGEYGDDTGRTLEISNTLISPMANKTLQETANIIAKNILDDGLRGYAYHPYEATDSVLDLDAEVGDAVTVGGVYGVIAKQELVFDDLGLSSVSASGGDETENEFGLYTSRIDREVARSLHGLSTRLIVESGKISAEVDRATTAENGIRNDYAAAITVSAESITSTVASAQSKYDTSSISGTIDYYGYGTPTMTGAAYKNKQYLDQSSGFVYKANSTGTAWNKVNSTALLLITAKLSSDITQTAESITTQVSAERTRAEGEEEKLSSRISQTADDINLSVKGSYAPEWATSTAYYKDDVVKISYSEWASGVSYKLNDQVFVESSDGLITYYKCKKANTSTANNKPPNSTYWTEIDESAVAITYYKCKTANTSTANNKPPNSTYWTKVSPTSVQSMIDIGLEGITISSSNPGSGNNNAKITLKKGNVSIEAGTITMTNVVADSIRAENVIVGDTGSVLSLDELLSTEGGNTVIDGAYIKTGSIDADTIKADSSFIGCRYCDSDKTSPSSLFLSNVSGYAKLVYGAGTTITSPSDINATFGVIRDYVNSKAELYLGSKNILSTSSSVDRLYIEQDAFFNKQIFIDSDCYGSLPSNAFAYNGRIFFAKA